jgi:hypothetical protein
MTNWRPDPAVVPLGRGPTETGPDYAQPVGLADFPAGTYPACKVHGALLRMSQGDGVRPPVWRCDACGAGATWDRQAS